MLSQAIWSLSSILIITISIFTSLVKLLLVLLLRTAAYSVRGSQFSTVHPALQQGRVPEKKSSVPESMAG